MITLVSCSKSNCNVCCLFVLFNKTNSWSRIQWHYQLPCSKDDRLFEFYTSVDGIAGGCSEIGSCWRRGRRTSRKSSLWRRTSRKSSLWRWRRSSRGRLTTRQRRSRRGRLTTRQRRSRRGRGTTRQRCWRCWRSWRSWRSWRRLAGQRRTRDEKNEKQIQRRSRRKGFCRSWIRTGDFHLRFGLEDRRRTRFDRVHDFGSLHSRRSCGLGRGRWLFLEGWRSRRSRCRNRWRRGSGGGSGHHYSSQRVYQTHTICQLGLGRLGERRLGDRWERWGLRLRRRRDSIRHHSPALEVPIDWEHHKNSYASVPFCFKGRESTMALCSQERAYTWVSMKVCVGARRAFADRQLLLV